MNLTIGVPLIFNTYSQTCIWVDHIKDRSFSEWDVQLGDGLGKVKKIYTQTSN